MDQPHEYDWKLPTVWASTAQTVLLVFLLFSSHCLCWDQRGFFNQEETHVCYVSNIPKHTYLSNSMEGFLGSKWTDEVNVRDFIQNNYTQYDVMKAFSRCPNRVPLICSGNAFKASEGRARKGGVLESKLKSYPA